MSQSSFAADLHFSFDSINIFDQSLTSAEETNNFQIPKRQHNIDRLLLEKDVLKFSGHNNNNNNTSISDYYSSISNDSNNSESCGTFESSFASSLSSFSYCSSDDEDDDDDTVDSNNSQSQQQRLDSTVQDIDNAIVQNIDNKEIVEVRTKRVRFGGVTVRNHPVTIGYNTILCSLQLCWEYYNEQSFSSIDKFYASTALYRTGIVKRLSVIERRQWVSTSQNINLSDVLDLEEDRLCSNSNNNNDSIVSTYHDNIPVSIKLDTNPNSIMESSFPTLLSDRPPRLLCRQRSDE